MILQTHIREANILSKASDHPIMEAAIKNGGFLAGGAIRSVFASERINDFDIFFNSKAQFEKCIDALPDYQFTKTTSAWSYFTDEKQHFQLICAVFGEVEKIIEDFDFTVCMGAWIPRTTNFYLNEHFLKHLAQKRLCFNVKAEYPICSLWRVLKYTKRGYKLPAIEAIKLALRIHSIKLETHADFKKQLMGIDTIFLSALTDKLGELTPEAKYDFGEAINMIAGFINDKESEDLEKD